MTNQMWNIICVSLLYSFKSCEVEHLAGETRASLSRNNKKGNRVRFPLIRLVATYFSTGVPEVKRRENLFSFPR